MKPFPPQPDEKDWGFVRELAETPVHRRFRRWKRKSGRKEISLGDGIVLENRFPDPDRLLETAWADFRKFLQTADIPEGKGYPVSVDLAAVEVPETHRIEVTPERCAVTAGDTEGVRRALVWLEDEILRSGGPFLSLGSVERRPVIRTRISRCFYSPIHRPPKNRDELADDHDYYPDEYLNRLAHDGINGLWIYTSFRELIPSTVIPEFGKDSARRLAKLRRTVEKCRRYGIRVYAFCIEPEAFDVGDAVLAAHPELGGATSGKIVYFCPGTEKARAYLEEATRTLFRQVPHLGGIIDITVGEQATSCAVPAAGKSNCPRCSKRTPPEVLSDVVAAMERGMHSVAPEAEMISWPYGQLSFLGEKLVIKGAGQVPPGAILLYNFENGGGQRQLGRWREACDYWLSYIGPSKVFRECARQAVAHGTRIFAKLQVGNSHEVATVPFVPVPGNIHAKYRRMHRMGVTGALQCWFFGNYPSVQTKAAGEASFSTLSASKETFLLRLARRDWGKHARQVVKAWRMFEKGYRQYPTNIMVSYFGPMHDGVVWPLHLKPVDEPLPPSWLIGFPPSGDRIGDSVAYLHTLEEVVELSRGMAEDWQKGVRILDGLEPHFRQDPERMGDIRVARALGLQFRSGYNIYRFYDLREKMLDPRCTDRMGYLGKMRAIVEEELRIDRELLPLAEEDTRLGFHSESEGYKYFPAAIRWRMEELNRLLAEDFPEMESLIASRKPLFPAYTGEKPEGKVYTCRRVSVPPAMKGVPSGGAWEGIPEETLSYEGLRYACTSEILPEREPGARRTQWKAVHDGKAMYFGFTCWEPDMDGVLTRDGDRERMDVMMNDLVEIHIEPRRLWPCLKFLVNADGARYIEKRGFRYPSYGWTARAKRFRDRWTVTVRIPFKALGVSPDLRPALRGNILRRLPAKSELLSVFTYRWVLGVADGKADYYLGGTAPYGPGWMVLEDPAAPPRT